MILLKYVRLQCCKRILTFQTSCSFVTKCPKNNNLVLKNYLEKNSEIFCVKSNFSRNLYNGNALLNKASSTPPPGNEKESISSENKSESQPQQEVPQTIFDDPNLGLIARFKKMYKEYW